MRIPCPHCGSRDIREFSYLGDATVERPDPSAVDAVEQFTAYVYMRENPAGLHREFWYHRHGCQAWLVAIRNTRNHEITHVEPVKQRLIGANAKANQP